MRRPSAALTISCLALVGAWGGPAVAETLISSKHVRNNSLTSADVKDRSLKGRDVRSNTLTGRVVANLSGRDLLTDSLDGTDIDEDTLGPVPRARSAVRAESADRAAVADSVGGARIARAHFAEPAGVDGDVLALGGLRLKARCSSSGILTVLATTDSGPAWLRVTGTVQRTSQDTSPVLTEDDDFRAGEETNVLPGGADNVAGSIVYLAPEGTAVTVTFLAEHGVAASRGYACLFAGTAVEARA